MIILTLFLLNIAYPRLITDYAIGHQLFLQENYRDAKSYFEMMLRKYPDSDFKDEIRFFLAECCFNLNDYVNATKNFESIVKHKRSYLAPECLYALGLINILQHNYQEAESIIQKLLDIPAYQNEARANFGLGALYYFLEQYQPAKERLAGNDLLEARFYYGKTLAKLGQPLAAVGVFKEISDQAPNTPIALCAEFSSGEALFSNQDFAGAKVVFGDFIQRYPNSGLKDYADYFLATALLHEGEYAAAAERLTTLIRHHDNLLAAHSNYFLGICRMKLGDGPGATTAFQRVRANYPGTKIASYANLELTNALLASGDTLQALLSAAQLSTIFLSGELASVGRYLTGTIYFQEGAYANAAENFQMLLMQYPNSKLCESAACMFLYALNNLQKFDQTVTFGSKYIKDFPEINDPWRGRILYFLADAYYHDGNFSEAEKNYLAVCQDFPNLEISPYAKLGLGYAKYHQDRPREALEIFNSLSQAPFDDPSLVIAIYLGLGYTQYNQGEYLQALDAFEKITDTYPRDPRACVPGLFYAGMCYYNLQYYGQAIDAWEKIVATYPWSAKAAEAGFRAGDTYFKALEYSKARALFQWVIENHPLDEYAGSAQLAIAQSHYNESSFDDAIREFQKFLDLFPTAEPADNARQGMEMTYYRKGLESQEAMRQFIEKFPESELAADGQYQIAQKYFDEKNYEVAIDEFLKVVVNSPNSTLAPDVLLLAAEAAVNLGKWLKAQELYKHYIDYFPTGKERDGVYFNLGTAYFNLSDYGAALNCFETIVDSFPNSQYLENVRHNIEVCRRRLGNETSTPDSIQ